MCYYKVLTIVTPLLRRLLCPLLCLAVAMRAALVSFIACCRSQGKRPYVRLVSWLLLLLDAS
jgi:hypothetical protein